MYDKENIFAKILRGDIPSTKVYEDEYTLAIMDVMPQEQGHVLVIPKLESENILDEMGDEHSLALMKAMQKIARATKEAMQADGITIHQFNGEAGGQSVFHLHFHIIPRFDGKPLAPHSEKMADPGELNAVAEKIRSAIR